MQNIAEVVVVLGTGGTIAGTAAHAADNLGYRAAQLSVQSLVAAVPGLAALPLQAEQVAQVDSKDMGHAVWQSLAQRVQAHLLRPEVAGVVVTHGTDTLEETAYLLHRVLAPHKPVVLTAAMRPASSLQADGPQNLLDAATVARHAGARGVVAVLAGRVLAAEGLRKCDSYRLDAFEGDEVARVEEGVLRVLRPWPAGQALGLDVLAPAPADWPRVAWLTSHAGFDAAVLRALVAAGVHGVVLAGTGNGSLHNALEAAAHEAVASGVLVHLCTRCASGRLVGSAGTWPYSPAQGPAQARVALLLELLQRRRAAAPTASKPPSISAQVPGSGMGAV